MRFAISKQIKTKDTIEVAIHDPRDKEIPTDIVIEIAGRYSPQGKAAQFALADESRKDGDTVAAAQWDARLLDLITACTVGWRGVSDDKNVAVECSAELARALYVEAPWIREQVQSEYLTLARFFESAKVR